MTTSEQQPPTESPVEQYIKIMGYGPSPRPVPFESSPPSPPTEQTAVQQFVKQQGFGPKPKTPQP